VLVLALPAGAARPQRAELRLRSTAPLVVSGAAFGPGETVVLTLRAASLTRALVARAKRNGAFTARFRIRVDRCSPFTVRAVGTRGSRAVLRATSPCKQEKGPPKRALPKHEQRSG
jgi:hypothetical protein